jgi:hypothetical protein
MYRRVNVVFSLALFKTLSSHALCTSSSSSTTTTMMDIDQRGLYNRLTTKLSEIEKLSGVKGLLGWDEMVMLQPGSASARNDQKVSSTSNFKYCTIDLKYRVLIPSLYCISSTTF